MLLDRNAIEYRLQMRQFLDSIGDRRSLAAASHVLRAAIASPALFVRRVYRAIPRGPEMTLGIEPSVFKRNLSTLWPSFAASRF
jgi:hypothetical protein